MALIVARFARSKATICTIRTHRCLHDFTEKGGTGGACHAHSHGLADVVSALIEHHHLVLPCATAQLLTTPLAEILSQNVKLLALVSLVGDGGHLVLQGD